MESKIIMQIECETMDEAKKLHQMIHANPNDLNNPNNPRHWSATPRSLDDLMSPALKTSVQTELRLKEQAQILDGQHPENLVFVVTGLTDYGKQYGLESVKEVRQATGLGLKDAKWLVDTFLPLSSNYLNAWQSRASGVTPSTFAYQQVKIPATGFLCLEWVVVPVPDHLVPVSPELVPVEEKKQ